MHNTLTMKLQALISPQYNPFLNRAVEQYLTDNQEEDTVTMYLWKNQQTVVIGYNQNPYSECNVQLLLDEGGHLMRRGTAAIEPSLDYIVAKFPRFPFDKFTSASNLLGLSRATPACPSA